MIGKSLESVIVWQGSSIRLLDQRRLPDETTFFECATVADVDQAIREMVVRGAPAIGITAAYGVVLAAQGRFQADTETWHEAVEEDLQVLARSRPTAVNLVWAIERMRGCIERAMGELNPLAVLVEEAMAIHEEERQANLKMAELAYELFDDDTGVLTHCNTGALATGAYGTALGVIRHGFQAGKITRVYADETRPWLQGSRLTAWELVQDHIPVTVIADGAGAHLMKTGNVQWLIIGADRIMANGDAANKIGTYHAAIAAKYHGVKVMFVAPTSTVDMSLSSGTDVTIEERSGEEILAFRGRRVASERAEAWNPVFDVTPAGLIDAIVTEKGVVLAPDKGKMAAMMS